MSFSSNPFNSLIKTSSKSKVVPYSPTSSRRRRSESAENSPPTTPTHLFRVDNKYAGKKDDLNKDLNLDKDEFFPTLGNNTNKNEVSVQEDYPLTANMDYSKHLTEEHEKPESEPDKILPGWAQLHKDGSIEYGKETEGNQDLMDWMEDLDESRQRILRFKTLQRYRRYKIEDEYKFGIPTLQSWEINDYISEMNLQSVQENKYNSNRPGNSDGEYSDHEESQNY
jgi:hypothetical protein